MHRAAEAIPQLLVDHIQVRVEIRRKDVVGSRTIGFIALLEMTGLKHEIAILHGHPDMLTRIAVTPLEEESVFIFIEASLPIQVVPVEHMQHLLYSAGLDDPCCFRSEEHTSELQSRQYLV